jgi:hypothetical protein
VIHGTHDTVCDVSGGKATAATIPSARLVLIEGMSHDIPAALWQRIADHIDATIRRGRSSHFAVPASRVGWISDPRVDGHVSQGTLCVVETFNNR